MLTNESVITISFPKVRQAFLLSFLPKALEITEPPPTPIAIPKAEIKKETGNTTLMAAIAVDQIQFPTNIVSTTIFNEITKIPNAEGILCIIIQLSIG